MRTKTKMTHCAQCSQEMDLAGHIGRPPYYCGTECRRAGRAAEERLRRAQRAAEIERLRQRVAMYEAALAA